MPKKQYRKKYPKKVGMVEKVARKEVKKQLAKEIENKIWDGYLLADGASNAVSAIGFSLQMTNEYSLGILGGTAITQGTGVNQYVGERIQPVLLEFRYAIDIDQTITGDAHNTVTLLFWQAKGAFVPSVTSAASQFQLTGDVLTPFSAINDAFDDRMRVIKRKTITIDNDDPSKHGVVFLNRKHMRRIKFNGAAGVPEVGTICVTAVSDSTASEHPNIRCYWRLHYEDA